MHSPEHRFVPQGDMRPSRHGSRQSQNQSGEAHIVKECRVKESRWYGSGQAGSLLLLFTDANAVFVGVDRPKADFVYLQFNVLTVVEQFRGGNACVAWTLD